MKLIVILLLVLGGGITTWFSVSAASADEKVVAGFAMLLMLSGVIFAVTWKSGQNTGESRVETGSYEHKRGTAEDGAEIIASHDVLGATVTKGLADADMGTSMTRAASIQGGYTPSWSGTTAVYATINTTGANTSVLSTGSTTFYLITERF